MLPVFTGMTGPQLIKALREWMEAHPVREITIAGERRLTGIEYRGRNGARTRPPGKLFELVTSVESLREEKPLTIERFLARTVVVASGFEDKWPDIEVDESAERLYEKYRAVFRYAGNAKGWHVCIRCDGHLHVDQHIAILGVGDYVYGAALGAQDFTDKITILTNGRPHGMSPPVLRQIQERGIEIIEAKIKRHIGEGTDLLGLEFEDGRSGLLRRLSRRRGA